MISLLREATTALLSLCGGLLSILFATQLKSPIMHRLLCSFFLTIAVTFLKKLCHYLGHKYLRGPEPGRLPMLLLASIPCWRSLFYALFSQCLSGLCLSQTPPPTYWN